MPKRKFFLVTLTIWTLCTTFVGGCIPFYASQSSTEVAKQFFDMELQGNFGGSWELFHPEMQERWSKEAYIQKRAHVLMQEMGADNFVYETGQVKRLDEWVNPQTGTVFADVDVVPTKMTFSSTFGMITLLQNFYMVKEGGRWYILWEWDVQPQTGQEAA